MKTKDSQTQGKSKKRQANESKFKYVSRKKKRNLFVLATLTPLAIWMAIYMFGPIVTMIINSFTDAHMAYDTKTFVGLYQYEKMFTDSTFIIALQNSIKVAFIIVPTTLVLSTLTAVALNALSDKLRQFYTFIYFVPSILSVSAICIVWRWLYHANYGLFNFVLNFFGFPSQQFLNSEEQALICLCVIQIWAIFGYYAVIILANMRGIDKSLYEAADIAGANAVQKFIYITIPMLKNTFIFVLIMVTTVSFMFFTPVRILTKGTPGTSTMVLLLYMMNKGITQSDIGYASAIAVILLIIILFFSLVQWLLVRERKAKNIKLKKGGYK